MDLDLGREHRVGTPEVADELLDAGVNVRTIEGGDAGVDEQCHVLDGLMVVNRAVIPGDMPSSLEESRRTLAVAQGMAWNHREPCLGRGTAVTSERLK